VMARPDIALDALSQRWFVPKISSCIGSSPQLCLAGKVHLTHECELSLLMSELRDCSIKFDKSTPGIKVFHESNDIHQIVLFSPTEMDIILKCIDATPKMITILSLYKLTLHAGCSITDEENSFRIDSTYTMEKSYSFELHEQITIPALKVEWPEAAQILSMPEFVETGNLELSFDEMVKLQDPFVSPPFFRGEKGTLRTVVITMAVTIVIGIICVVLVRIYGVRLLYQKLASCLCLVCNIRTKTVFESTLTPDVASTGHGDAPTSTSMAETGLISFKTSFMPKVPATTPPSAPFLTAPPAPDQTTPASAYPHLQDEATRL